MKRRPTTIRLGALAVLLPAAIALPASAGSAVRNIAPETPRATVAQRRPVYYPRDRGPGSTGPALTAAAEADLRRFLDLHSALRYSEALVLARRVVEAAPDQPISHYNLACVLARLRRGDEALAALDGAVDRGWNDVTHTLIDPDLHSVRAVPAFRVVVGRMAPNGRPRPGPLRPEQLDGPVRAVLERHGVRRAAISLVRDGGVAWSRGFGIADAGSLRSLGDPFDVTAPLPLIDSIAGGPVGAGSRLVATAGRAEGVPAWRERVLLPLGMRDTRIARRDGRPVLRTTSGDLARLLVVMIGSDRGPGDAADPPPHLAPALDHVRSSLAAPPGQLVSHLGFRTVLTSRGPRLELAEAGCVIRWCPQAGTGLVVLTQGGRGPAAAGQLADLVLGDLDQSVQSPAEAERTARSSQ